MISQQLSSQEPLTVFMVGPSLKVRGGITSLIATLLRREPPQFRYRLVATHSDCKENGEGNLGWGRRALQAGVYLGAVVKLGMFIGFTRKKIFHVHISQEGSTIRKGIICALLRICRCRYLVHMHAAEDKQFHSCLPAPVRCVLLWGIRGCSYCLVLNNFWASHYEKRLGLPSRRLLILPNPADIPVERPDRTKRETLRFLFLGRIGARKGAFDLVRAFSLLPEEVKSKCRLTLAGDGETQGVFRLASANGCTAQVDVTGWLNRSDVNGLLGDCDVLVLPSYAEGMAIAVLEGMAWGLAVITTDVCGATSFLESRQNCLLVSPGDIDGLSEAIKELYSDADLRQVLGCNARATAETLSIHRYMEILSAIYSDVSAGRPPAPVAVAQESSTVTHISH
jgi:glycosyltransferase involved in cell wall biosynthesis